MIDYVCPNCQRSFQLANVRKRVFCVCGVVAHNPEWAGVLVNVGEEYDWSCENRGQEIGTVDCGCSGSPKAFSCSVHGVCTIRKLSHRMSAWVDLQGKKHDCELRFCNRCGDRVPLDDESNGVTAPATVQVGSGPGTELFGMLKELGIESKEGCSCQATADQMDIWGVVGCRVEKNFNWILGEIDKNAEHWSWSEKLAIAAKASLNANHWKLGWKINPLAVHRSLVKEAIRRAEMKIEKKETGSWRSTERNP